MPRILVTDQIAEDGVAVLRKEGDVDVCLKPSPEELIAMIGDYDALVVRSDTKVTAQVIGAAKRMQVIGRAGSGYDNIDVDAATHAGIVVVNAPTGNTLSAAEHTIALMMAVARHIPEANASLRAGDWNRQQFIGVELRGKTLGLVGLGQVGAEVASRGRGLEMRVIANDPFVSPERAQSMGVELVDFEDLLAQSDFISLHTRLTPDTRNKLGDEQLHRVKPGVRIINTARGELIEEAALIAAIDDGRVAGAAIDVFREEPPGENPLLKHPKIIVTPHLGALTPEAQERAAVDVAHEVLAVLRGEPARYAVNAPLVSQETLAVLRPFFDVAEKTASLATQLSDGQLRSVEIEYLGEIAEVDCTPLKAAAIKGLLAPISDEHVTIVNAAHVAEHRGLRISERKGPSEDYVSLLTIRLSTDQGAIAVSGTTFHDGTHIVALNEFGRLDIPASGGHYLFCQNLDRPGMLLAVTGVVARRDINVGEMRLDREKVRGRAMMVLALDDEVAPDVLKELEAIPDLYKARVARL
jgi:D-3-phosphoglycerate dehydrogenase